MKVYLIIVITLKEFVTLDLKHKFDKKGSEFLNFNYKFNITWEYIVNFLSLESLQLNTHTHTHVHGHTFHLFIYFKPYSLRITFSTLCNAKSHI